MTWCLMLPRNSDRTVIGSVMFDATKKKSDGDKKKKRDRNGEGKNDKRP